MNKKLLAVFLPCFFGLLNQPFYNVSAQSITLSSPTSSSTYVDTAFATYSISDPSGTPQQIQLVFTYTSGYYTNSIGSAWTLTMKSSSNTSSSFTIRPMDPNNTSNTYTVSPNTSMLEGTYSVYAQYIRSASAGGATLRSTTRTGIYLDLLTLPPGFTHSPSVTIDTNTGIFSLTNHFLVNNTPVTLSGVNGGVTNTYYVSVLDSNTFKLTATAGGSNYLAVSSSSSPKVIYPALLSNSIYGGTKAVLYYTLAESSLSGSTKMTFTGPTNVTLVLPDNTLTSRFLLDRNNILGSTNIVSSTGTNLPDGAYSISFSYQDRYNHPASTNTLTNVVFESTTQPPVLTSLASGSRITDGSAINYLLPEPPLPGSVLLTFASSNNNASIPLGNSSSTNFTYSLATYGTTIPSGIYTVTLSYSDYLGNPAASTSVTGVYVSGPPVISSDVTNETADIGSNVTFQVGVSGIDTYSYQWYFSSADPQATAGGYALTYADFVYAVVLTNGGYDYAFAPNVRFAGGTGSGVAGYASVSNGSVYSVIITNAGFGYTVPPAVIIDPPQTPLANETNSSLTVGNFGPLNLGSYWVVVSDGYGTVTSSVATATLASGTTPVPPGIAVPPASTNVPLYGSASLSVTASGTPPFYYQWTQGGTNLPSATNSALQLAFFRTANVGAYAAIVSSPYGSVTSSVAQVSMLPSLNRPFTGITPLWGQPATLSVGAVGTGALQYQWYFNGQAINGATASTFSMDSVQFTNAGFYSVVVTSSLGSVTNTPYQVVVNPANIRLGLFPGVIITGTTGNSYTIQASTDLSSATNWVTMTNVTLAQPVQVWYDETSDTTLPGNPKKFYRIMVSQ